MLFLFKNTCYTITTRGTGTLPSCILRPGLRLNKTADGGTTMDENWMELLVSLDQNYLPQLRVMLTSLTCNDPGVHCRVWLLHSGIPQPKLDKLAQGLEGLGHRLEPVLVDQSLFGSAPVTDRYPQEMYYRLLAAQLLPDTLDRVLYLDPDILVINSLQPLWNTPLGDDLFAAANHVSLGSFATNEVNKIRLGTDTDYFNSGVLLIDLARCRQEVDPKQVFAYVEKHQSELFLPDQDVLNALYGARILPLEDLIWNYDPRNYSEYKLHSHGKADTRWVIQNTAVLHFCGRDKPWKKGYRRRFGALYLHYMHLADRMLPA